MLLINHIVDTKQEHARALMVAAHKRDEKRSYLTKRGNNPFEYTRAFIKTQLRNIGRSMRADRPKETEICDAN